MRGVRMMMRLKVLGWYDFGHIMKRQNGKEGKGLAASWEGEFPRYTRPNKVVEMEVEALLVGDGGCSREDFKCCSIQRQRKMKVQKVVAWCT
jgi:hypothetical protein